MFFAIPIPFLIDILKSAEEIGEDLEALLTILYGFAGVSFVTGGVNHFMMWIVEKKEEFGVPL